MAKATTDGARKAVEADLGPVQYLATLIGSTDEQTMPAFIPVVALLLDLAAVAAVVGRDASGAPIDLDKLVARVVLDIKPLYWFATPQGRSPGCD